MPRRRRWQNIKGTLSRVSSPPERLMVSLVSLGARALAPFLAGPGTKPPREVLVLRLDRIGDVLMSLPALGALREALPQAFIRLAVGEWSKEVANDAPVDEVLVWSAPWVGRRDEGALSRTGVLRAARAARVRKPDLAIDLQGDVRALWLMAMTGARTRVGYANTGSAALLSTVVDLDEDINFVEQNYRAMETALGRTLERRPFRWLSEGRRKKGRETLAAALGSKRLRPNGPIVGLHPGAGRGIKEWPLDRYVEVGRRLVEERGALLVLTGSETERPKTAFISAALPSSTLDLCGQLGLGGLAEVMSAFDGFISGDTSAMHFACALGLPSVAIFGPSDPGRYFSGGKDGFGSERHLALTADLWCRPCNLIRRPPEECAQAPVPECLAGLTPQQVFEATLQVLNG